MTSSAISVLMVCSLGGTLGLLADTLLMWLARDARAIAVMVGTTLLDSYLAWSILRPHHLKPVEAQFMGLVGMLVGLLVLLNQQQLRNQRRKDREMSR